MKRTLKSALSLILTMALLFGVAAPALAQSEDVYHYVALGDSCTNGFGLPGFVFKKCGRFCDLPEAYINLMRDYLESKGLNVDYKNLALTGMRNNELLTFLDESVTYEDCDAFGQMRWGEYMQGAYSSPAELREAYRSAIKEADLITYDLGINNFSNYMVAKIAEGFGIDVGMRWGYENDHFNDLMAKYSIDISVNFQNDVTELIETATKGAISQELIERISDAFLYSYANFIIGFSKSMDIIYDLNPDVQVIVVGIGNTFNGVSAKIGSAVIDLGSLWGALIELANIYMMDINEHKSQYKYADTSSGIELIMDAVARGELYPQIVDAMLEMFYDDSMLGKDAASQFIGSLAGKDKVSLNEAKQAYYSDENTPVKTAVESILNTYIKAAGYSDPLDIVAGAPILIEEGMEAFGNIFTEAFTDYDNASELAKGILHVWMYRVNNSATTHPSVAGHQQKFKAVVNAYESDIAADGTHLVRAVSGMMNMLTRVFKSPNWFKALMDEIRGLFKSILQPFGIFC